MYLTKAADGVLISGNDLAIINLIAKGYLDGLDKALDNVPGWQEYREKLETRFSWATTRVVREDVETYELLER